LDLLQQPKFIPEISTEATQINLSETNNIKEDNGDSEEDFEWIQELFNISEENSTVDTNNIEFVSSTDLQEILNEDNIFALDNYQPLEESWPKKLEKAIKEIYTTTTTTNEKLVQYYKLGELLNNQPFTYRTKMSEIKKDIDKVIGKKLYEKPYNIAQKVVDIYKSEEETLENKFELTPSKLFHLKKTEILKLIN
jgi:hypothetical protein